MNPLYFVRYCGDAIIVFHTVFFTAIGGGTGEGAGAVAAEAENVDAGPHPEREPLAGPEEICEP
jgi:hypothetical protein